MRPADGRTEAEGPPAARTRGGARVKSRMNLPSLYVRAVPPPEEVLKFVADWLLGISD